MPQTWLCRTAPWLAILLGATAQAEEIRYVDRDAPPGGDGTSWVSAYRYLQDALAAPLPPGGETVEIRIAQGYYVTDRDEAHADGSGDRHATFQLVNGVVLKGGYAGLGAADPDERDIDAFETTLSGDLLGDDGNAYGNYGENSYHVVTGTGTDETAVLDGVTLRSGNADESDSDPYGFGGGLTIDGGSPQIIRCTFFKNLADWGAAASARYEGRPTFSECRVIDNYAGHGGGLLVAGDGALLIDCTIEANTANARGGGVYNGGMLTLLRCTFTDNVADGSEGGGLYVSGGPVEATTLVVGCTFTGNSGSRGGGISCESSNLTVVNCLLYGNYRAMRLAGYEAKIINTVVTQNTSYQTSGGIDTDSPMCTIANCIVWGNTPSDFQYSGGYDPDVYNSDLTGAPPGGVANIDSDPMFVDAGAGDFRLALGSPCIDRGLAYFLPPDVLDLNGNGDTTEPVPYDFDGNDRVTNVYPDMGAYEFQGPFGPLGDIDHDGVAGTSDFLILLADWGFCCAGDLDCDHFVGDSDLDAILAMLGPCPPGPCSGDLNHDGVVDNADILLLLDLLEDPGPCPNCYADLNGDCRVGVEDVLILLANWS